MKLCRSLCILAVVAAFAVSSYAQAAAATALKVQEQKLASKLMAREMPYRVLLPAGYETAKAERYPVIYLLHGLYGHYTNWTDKTKVAEYAAKYRFIIVTPEGADGWYIDSPLASHENYESYIVKELIPEIDAKFRTKADRNDRVIAGLSMGGYGALKFGLKYPEMFTLIGSFSGAFGTSQFTEKAAGDIGKTVDVVFGPVGSKTRLDNDVYELFLGTSQADLRTLPFIYLSCGTEDFLFESSRQFDGLLRIRNVPHEYRELPGVHDWVFWDDQVREFLAVADRHLAARKK
ncbi:MAG: esterase family protein [Pyrinomonadaceae bacterium]|nr:esterase family protein [Pyrinomonadaceae bacterium]